jgi:hypothetical protein
MLLQVVWSETASSRISTSAKPHAGGRIRCSGMSWRCCSVARQQRDSIASLQSADPRISLRALIPTLHMRALAKPCLAFVLSKCGSAFSTKTVVQQQPSSHMLGRPPACFRTLT